MAKYALVLPSSRFHPPRRHRSGLSAPPRRGPHAHQPRTSAASFSCRPISPARTAAPAGSPRPSTTSCPSRATSTSSPRSASTSRTPRRKTSGCSAPSRTSASTRTTGATASRRVGTIPAELVKETTGGKADWEIPVDLNTLAHERAVGPHHQHRPRRAA